jgi:lipopolysaccharide export system permease protein
LSIACIVLFLIGAPLGSIIRKGGLGTPLVLAIVFFVIFFLLNNFGEKFAKSGEWTVYKGMWFSSAILIPVGLFLTYKAMRDSQLFNQEFYYRLLQPFKVTLRKYFKK